MPVTRVTNNVLASNAALNNLNAGANITFTKQVIIPSLSGAAFGTGVITALSATTNTGSGLVTVDGVATLTNKTLTTPTIGQINAQSGTPLFIQGNAITSEGVLAIRQTSSSQNSIITFRDQTAATRGAVGYGNTLSTILSGTMYLQGGNGIPLVLGTNDTERMRILSGGQVGIGTSTPNSTAVLELSSTTRGFLPPRMTTVERDAISTPATGLTLYNTTTNTINYRNASAWDSIVPASSINATITAFLASPTSDNLRAAVTNETGTEALVFANGPRLIDPTIQGNLIQSTIIKDGPVPPVQIFEDFPHGFNNATTIGTHGWQVNRTAGGSNGFYNVVSSTDSVRAWGVQFCTTPALSGSFSGLQLGPYNGQTATNIGLSLQMCFALPSVTDSLVFVQFAGGGNALITQIDCLSSRLLLYLPYVVNPIELLTGVTMLSGDFTSGQRYRLYMNCISRTQTEVYLATSAWNSATWTTLYDNIVSHSTYTPATTMTTPLIGISTPSATARTIYIDWAAITFNRGR